MSKERDLDREYRNVINQEKQAIAATRSAIARLSEAYVFEKSIAIEKQEILDQIIKGLK